MNKALDNNDTQDAKKTSETQSVVKKPVATKLVKIAPSAATNTPDRVQNGFFKQALRFMAILGVGFFGGMVAVRLNSPTTSISQQVGESVVLQESELISTIAEEVNPSVVSINIRSAEAGFFGRSFSSGGAGTGIIISSDGYIVTNKHVIPENTTDISVVLDDGTTYDEVEVVGRDPFTDVAFIKIQGVSDLKPAVLGESSSVRVGDKVIAIGNALGEFSNTVTSGIISGLSRPIVAGDGVTSSESLQNLFQTDASINPGNSGGPLLNASGQVIGINTAVAGNAENIGFAIPINDVISGIETVLESGELIKPFVGVRYISLNPEIASSLNLPVDQGAYLDSSVERGASVVRDSPAEKAGLKDGDIIIKANGDDVNDDSPLGVLISRAKVGDTLSLIVLRGGEEVSIDVVLERVPENLQD